MRRLLFVVGLLAAGAVPAQAVRAPGRAREDAKRFGLNRLERPLRRAPDEAAKNAFSRFNAASGGRWMLRFDPRTGAPAALSEGRTSPRLGPATAVAARFLAEQVGFLGVDPASLAVERETTGDGHRHVLYRQTYRGLNVEFARVKVHMAGDGSIIGFNSNYEPRLTLAVTPALSGAAAARAAEADSQGLAQGAAELVILPVEATGRAHLAWKVKVYAPQAAWRYYVDALTGQVLFRYNNLRFAVCLASGVVSGAVFDVDPSLTPGPVVRPIKNQWVYIADASTRALTLDDPVYGPGFFCGGGQGKVSMSLQGPYVNAANFRGPSAHYDNGNGVWQTLATPLSSPHPYPNSSVLVSTINLTLAAPTAVKFLPVFNNASVGLFSDGPDPGDGDIADDDQLTLTDANGEEVASYVGARGAFNATAVAGRVMRLVLKSNESGQQYGYDVALSSYLALSSPFTYGASGTSSHVWTAADAPIGLRGELNVFYHLNLMHDYFFNDVNRSSVAAVTRPVLAMAHVGPDLGGAFYNPDYDNLMFGDGGNPTAPSDLFTDDATVSHHEYTHYLVEKIWPIQNFGQAGAISEAGADYFSATSLNVSAIGAYALAGTPAAIRELDCPTKTACKVLSNATWSGAIHDDSIFLSQALWDIRRNRISALGSAAGRSCVDGLVFQSLLFFPESFGEFYDAMRRVDSAGRVAACAGAGSAQAAINTAFGPGPIGHGLILGSGDVFERNDGFETATDVSTRSAVSATISPSGDTDFWSFAAGPGLIRLTLTLPASGGYFKAYQLKLFDRSHRLVATAAPPYNGFNTVDGSCEVFDCTTTASSVVLAYNNPTGGQFYAQVAGGDTFLASASGVQSSASYSLVFEYPKAAALAGSIVSANFDNDIISFAVNVTSFVSIQDWRFSSAQLRDQSFSQVANTRVNIPALSGDFLTFVSSGSGLGKITGAVRLVSGFAARFPAVGTVYLEVFGYNVSGSTASLGLSNPMNLTTSKAELTAYNNIFNPARGERATVKYAITGAGRVVVKLYTVTGTFVATLLDGDMPAGKGSLDWDGRNFAGAVVASGVYVVRIEGPGIRKTQKIAIVK